MEAEEKNNKAAKPDKIIEPSPFMSDKLISNSKPATQKPAESYMPDTNTHKSGVTDDQFFDDFFGDD